MFNVDPDSRKCISVGLELLFMEKKVCKHSYFSLKIAKNCYSLFMEKKVWDKVDNYP